MRALATVGLTLTLAVSGVAIANAATPGTRAPATVRTVVRPVTATGHAASGYSVTAEPDGTVTCSPGDASPAAVDRNILVCSPAAAYAVACWKAARPHHVLCLRNARKKQLARLPLQGRFGHAAAPRHPAPLDLTLHSGVYCTIRIGGAGAKLRHHPNYAATYYCRHNLAIWAKFSDRSLGVNRGHPSWTVQVAKANGRGPLSTRHVARGWFVGTQPPIR